MGKPSKNCTSKMLTWTKVPNTVEKRMIDSSLIHELIPQRRICRRTKILNNVLKRYTSVKNYKQYVNFKTAVLRNIIEDEETDNAEVFTDDDYSTLHKTTLPSRKERSVRICDRTEVLENEITRIDFVASKETKKKKTVKTTRKNSSLSKKSLENTKERKEKKKSFPKNKINVGWQEVIRKKTDLPDSFQESTSNLRNQHSDINNKAEGSAKSVRRPTRRSRSKIQLSLFNSSHEDETNMDLAQSVRKVKINSTENVNEDNTKCIKSKESTIKKDNNLNELDNSNATIINETSTDVNSPSIIKTPENVKRNLTTLLSNAGQKYDENTGEQNDKTNTLEWSNLTFSNVHLAGQSTPIQNTDTCAKHLLSSEEKTPVHPKDSGIDEDSQDSTSEGNGKKKWKEKLKSLKHKDKNNLGMIHEQETSKTEESQEEYKKTDANELLMQENISNSNKVLTQKEDENIISNGNVYETETKKEIKEQEEKEEEEESQKFPVCITNTQNVIDEENSDQSKSKEEEEEKYTDQPEFNENEGNTIKSELKVQENTESESKEKEEKNTDQSEFKEDKENTIKSDLKEVEENTEKSKLKEDKDNTELEFKEEEEEDNTDQSEFEKGSKKPQKSQIHITNTQNTIDEENTDQSEFEREDEEPQKSPIHITNKQNTIDGENSDRSEATEEEEQTSSPKKVLDNENQEDIGHLEAEETQRQKLPPKVMCTQIVNKKYRIIHDEESCSSKANTHAVDHKTELNLPNTSTGIYSDAHSDASMAKLEMSGSSEDEKGITNRNNAIQLTPNKNIQNNNIHMDADSDEEYMSPTATRRLNQLRRLNLTEDSEPSSEDEIPSSQMSVNDKKNMLFMKRKEKINNKKKSHMESIKENSDSEDSDTDHAENHTKSNKNLNKSHSNSSAENLANKHNDNSSDSDSVEDKDMKANSRHSWLSLKKSNSCKKKSDNEIGIEQSQNEIGVSEKSDIEGELTRDINNENNITLERNSESTGTSPRKSSSFQKTANGQSKLNNTNSSVSNEADSLYYIIKKLNSKRRKNNEEEEHYNALENSSCIQTPDNTSQERPHKLQDLINYQELPKETSSRFSLKDLSEDDEILILNVPITLDVEKLQGKTLKLKEDKIRLGKHKYKYIERLPDTMSCILRSGKKYKRYKTVNIKPIRSIIVQTRVQKNVDTNPKTDTSIEKRTYEDKGSQTADNVKSINTEKLSEKDTREKSSKDVADVEDKYIFWKKKRLKRDFSNMDFGETKIIPHQNRSKSKKNFENTDDSDSEIRPQKRKRKSRPLESSSDN